MRFRFFRLRFHFTATGSIRFPEGSPANILRGAFGHIFRKLACVPDCPGADRCPRRASCAYARTFEPVAESGPSGFANPPRPFVFRASHLDGVEIRRGMPFHFDVHLFDVREPAISWFVLTFAELSKEGLGPVRGTALLDRVEELDLTGSSIRAIDENGTIHEDIQIEPHSIDLTPRSMEAVKRIEVRFVTPVELKSHERLLDRPDFRVLIARVRDRISTLGALYGDGPLNLDFAQFGERARDVQMLEHEVSPVSTSRVSSRTGQRHSLGGLTGTAIYEGPVGEFVPFLEAARYCGVGRQTTWGKGEIAVRYLE